MPQSYSRIVLHTTFSTKYRLPTITPYIEQELYAVMCAEFKKHGCKVYRIGGVPDHVHIIHSLTRISALAEIIRQVKSVSSVWIKKKGREFRAFAWQTGYSTFSVDYRNMDGVVLYVDRQKEHHGWAGRGMTFEEEYEKLLQAYNITDYDRRYLFPAHPDKAA